MVNTRPFWISPEENHTIRHKQVAAAGKQSFGADCSLVDFVFVDRRS
jgi:hypothetical protein